MTETDIARRALGAGWEKGPPFGPLHTFSHPNGLAAILSIAVYGDGKRWVHLSLSRHNRIPDWLDLNMVRDEMLGKDRKALMVLAPESEHVNIHQYCHHLWHCLGEDPLPDFTMGSGSL